MQQAGWGRHRHAACSPPHCRRYTQFVTVHSRPVHARLDLGPLAKALNRWAALG